MTRLYIKAIAGRMRSSCSCKRLYAILSPLNNQGSFTRLTLDLIVQCYTGCTIGVNKVTHKLIDLSTGRKVIHRKININ